MRTCGIWYHLNDDSDSSDMAWRQQSHISLGESGRRDVNRIVYMFKLFVKRYMDNYLQCVGWKKKMFAISKILKIMFSWIKENVCKCVWEREWERKGEFRALYLTRRFLNLVLHFSATIARNKFKNYLKMFDKSKQSNFKINFSTWSVGRNNWKN